MNVKPRIWLGIPKETRFHMLVSLARYQRKTKFLKSNKPHERR